MKMTRLEWTYLQRIALDHPYFDTHKLPLTEKEAKAIVEANNTMTGREFVDSIYAKLGITRPQEEKKRFAWLRSIGELFTVPPIRKIAIAVLVVLLMTVFFAATPTGRAIAESVIHYIGALFDDGIVTVNRSDNEAAMIPVDDVPESESKEKNEQESGIVYVKEFEDFIAATGVRPIVLPFPHTELFYDYDKSIDYLQLNAAYETSKGPITTFQIWNAEALSASTLTGFSIYDEESSFYYSTEDNGKIYVTLILDNSIFGIISEGSFTLDELISLLLLE